MSLQFGWFPQASWFDLTLVVPHSSCNQEVSPGMSFSCRWQTQKRASKTKQFFFSIYCWNNCKIPPAKAWGCNRIKGQVTWESTSELHWNMPGYREDLGWNAISAKGHGKPLRDFILVTWCKPWWLQHLYGECFGGEDELMLEGKRVIRVGLE